MWSLSQLRQVLPEASLLESNDCSGILFRLYGRNPETIF